MSFTGVRDLRDQAGRLSSIAQILASGQPVVMLTSSVARTFPVLSSRLPLDALCGTDIDCVVGACDRPVSDAADGPARVTLAEWEAAGQLTARLAAGTHAVVLDPPFRNRQVACLRAAAGRGAAVHLCYGDEERHCTARLLRYRVHPRFAMVCLYRAMQEKSGGEPGVFELAAQMAWQEAQVVLGETQLALAAAVLEELGRIPAGPGEARMDVRESPAYLAAEADYEECAKLCLTL